MKGKVSYRTACEGKTHRICERLVKLWATDLVPCMTGEEAARKIQLVPSADDRFQRRTQDCAESVLVELVRRLRLSKLYTVQLEDSTDVNLAVMLVFYR